MPSHCSGLLPKYDSRCCYTPLHARPTCLGWSIKANHVHPPQMEAPHAWLEPGLWLACMQAGHVRLVEREEVVAASWDSDYSWDAPHGKGAHAQGAMELLLAGTGAAMPPKAVAKALRDAESPAAHSHSHNHGHSHGHGHAHGHKRKGGGHAHDAAGSSSSGEEALQDFVPNRAAALAGSSSWGRRAEEDHGAVGEDGILHAHHVWLATGSVVDVRAEPVFQGLMAAAPVEVHGGMPMLEEDLRWVGVSCTHCMCVPAQVCVCVCA